MGHLVAEGLVPHEDLRGRLDQQRRKGRHRRGSEEPRWSVRAIDAVVQFTRKFVTLPR